MHTTGQMSAEALRDAFRRSFPVASGASDLRTELEQEFEIGSDPNQLTCDQRALHKRALDEITGAVPVDAPYFDQAYDDLLSRKPSMTLSLHGRTRSNGSFHLSPARALQFAHYGVLRQPLSSVGSATLTSVERLLDHLYNDLMLGSTTAFLFDPSLLGLVLNKEIIESVSTLLGDDVTFVGSDGPMYLAPGAETVTQWHSASGRDFGGEDPDSDLDLVTCWVALSDARIDNGCMRMVPGSFVPNGLKDRLLNYTTWDAAIEAVVSTFRNQRYRFRADFLAKMLARRIGYENHPGLYYVDGAGNPGKYNGFHSSLERDIAMGPKHLGLLGSHETVALEADRGDIILFTSRNIHASFRNKSDRWRKAISLRYVRTKKAHPTDNNHHYEELLDYFDRVPRTRRLFERFGKTVDSFKDTMPRICVTGAIPGGEEELYFDANCLREELESGSLILPGRERAQLEAS